MGIIIGTMIALLILGIFLSPIFYIMNYTMKFEFLFILFFPHFSYYSFDFIFVF